MVDDTVLSCASSRKDTVDSIRLAKHSSRASLVSIDWPTETASQSSNDFDIDALESEFEQLSLESAANFRLLKKDPKNVALREALAASKNEMTRIKEWSSLVHTAEGLAIVREGIQKKRMMDINKRKYEIDEVLKTVKAQSTADVCFLMDCTGSMHKYIDAAKTQIQMLTETVLRMFSTKIRLAFIGYRDIGDTLEEFDFTDDVSTFKTFLDTIETTGGDDACEDVFSKYIRERSFFPFKIQ